MPTSTNIKLKTIVSYFIFLLIGFGIGLLIFNINKSCDTDSFKYINKELICKDKLVVKKHSYEKLKNELKNFIEENKKENEITNVSIYFRDLQNGPTLGIDEYEVFSPASLLKLPLFLTYLNLSVDNRKFLDTEIVFEEKGEQYQYFSSKQSAKNNSSYTINTLLGYMIKYSDNKSYYALLEYLKQISPKNDLLRETFSDLGIIDPKDFSDQTLSVKSYGSIFVQLYHNSFFTKKELSEQALSVLAETDFDKGIKLGVPAHLKVAHKFGERSDLPDNKKQLHDCGIVYYPENPYLLCVMTRGGDFEQLSETIGIVSKMVYEEFNSRKI